MVEIATIFEQYGPAYRDRFGDRIPIAHLKIMQAIENCRTPVLGGHVYSCPDCGETDYLYHSCRNRHCPKCQNDKAFRWLEKQQGFLLPVPYFLLTFTLPSELRSLARSNPKTFYGILFRTSAASMQKLAQDEHFIGGKMGFIGVLHTWGRDLCYHPHVHYLVPAGGLNTDGNWKPSCKNFLLPVKALSVIFRAKFRDALRKADPDLFATIPPEVWDQDWIVHSQPVGDGLAAVRYLAPYIFRVAISNKRIHRLHGKVTFQYRATDTGKLRACTLGAEEFIRRFLQHVLPKGFVKVRYYGFFSPGCRPQLAALRRQLAPPPADEPVISEDSDDADDASCSVLCPTCKRPMVRGALIQPLPRSPPLSLAT
jgi:hypothetical protein